MARAKITKCTNIPETILPKSGDLVLGTTLDEHEGMFIAAYRCEIDACILICLETGSSYQLVDFKEWKIAFPGTQITLTQDYTDE